MSVTGIYGVIHETTRAVARQHSLQGEDVRLLVALAEHGPLRSDEVERRALTGATQVRRSSLTLRQRDLIVAESSDAKGGPTRKGVRMLLTLTDGGRFIARRVLSEMEGVVPEADRRERAA